jgi:hypothetical protein
MALAGNAIDAVCQMNRGIQYTARTAGHILNLNAKQVVG